METSPKEIWALCRVPRAELVYLRYTLEAYEGLCLATTLPGRAGLVRLATVETSRRELEAVLSVLAEEIDLKVERWGGGEE